MILQEFIRNFILYREVVRPVLSSWKDSLAGGYYKEIAGNTSSELVFALHNIMMCGDGEELGWDISDDYEAISLTGVSGTRTITDKHIIIQNRSEAEIFWETASVSKKISIMLTKAEIDEEIEGIGKTNNLTYASSEKNVILGMDKFTTTTTGFESKQIKSFLISETHEKREYLGEFSLTHEETPLFAISERGCAS